jgi:hypothetical protein
MGSMIARSMLAGFFGGVGDAIKASATTLAVRLDPEAKSRSKNQKLEN